MDNIIEFPSTGKGPDEPPLSVRFSATPEQMLEFCMGLMIEMQASLETMRINIATALTLLSHHEVLDLDEGNESYQQTRQAVLEGLCRRLQQRFPPKQGN
jgi:hypothetical protein